MTFKEWWAEEVEVCKVLYWLSERTQVRHTTSRAWNAALEEACDVVRRKVGHDDIICDATVAEIRALKETRP